MANIFSAIQILSNFFLLHIRNCDNSAIEVWVLLSSLKDYGFSFGSQVSCLHSHLDLFEACFKGRVRVASPIELT